MAGLGIVVVAGALIAALVLTRNSAATSGRSAATPDGTPAPGTSLGPSLVTAVLTANAYDTPSRDGDLLWILPAGQSARIEGRPDDSFGGPGSPQDWVLVSYPPGSTAVGWVWAPSLDLSPATLASAPPRAADAVQGTARVTDTGRTLPDLTLVDAFLLQEDRIAVTIRNGGDGAVRDASMSLVIARAEGEIVGVLRIGPTSLTSGATATIVTDLVAARAGTYLLSLDDGNEVAERREDNNGLSVLLLPQESTAPAETVDAADATATPEPGVEGESPGA